MEPQCVAPEWVPGSTRLGLVLPLQSMVAAMDVVHSAPNQTAVPWGGLVDIGLLAECWLFEAVESVAVVDRDVGARVVSGFVAERFVVVAVGFPVTKLRRVPDAGRGLELPVVGLASELSPPLERVVVAKTGVAEMQEGCRAQVWGR